MTRKFPPNCPHISSSYNNPTREFDFPFPISHFPFPISHFSFPTTTKQDNLVSHFPFSISWLVSIKFSTIPSPKVENPQIPPKFPSFFPFPIRPNNTIQFSFKNFPFPSSKNTIRLIFTIFYTQKEKPRFHSRINKSEPIKKEAKSETKPQSEKKTKYLSRVNKLTWLENQREWLQQQPPSQKPCRQKTSERLWRQGGCLYHQPDSDFCSYCWGSCPFPISF